MANKTIIQAPNKILKTKSTDITDMKEAKEIAKDLGDTLDNSEIPGVGISACQIGINKNIFIARKYSVRGDKEEYETEVFVNPKITNYSKKQTESIEGCLSIYDTYGFVNRAKSIKVEYLDLEGNKKTLKTGGFLAIVIQHEYDHLQGVLFTEKLIDNKIYTEKEIDRLLEKRENK